MQPSSIVLVFFGFVAALAPLATAATSPGTTGTVHPRLLFTADEVPALRTALTDGVGPDDAAYQAILTYSNSVLMLPPSALLGDWEGLAGVPQLALAAWIEPNGTAYADKARAVALEIALTLPPNNDEFTSALRLHVMALAWDMACENAPASERDAIRTAMRTYLDYMPPRFNYYCQAYNPYAGNHGMTVGTAMGLAVVALWDDVAPPDQVTLQSHLAFADDLVDKVLSDILPADGSYREGVLYAMWNMRVAVPWFVARQRFDGTDYGADPRLERQLDWLCYELSPTGGGRTNNLNDSAWVTRPIALHNTLLAWAQARWASPLAAYLHEHAVGIYGHDFGSYRDRVAIALWGRSLAVPNPATLLPTGRLFPDRGLYYARTGWKTVHTGNEMVFSFFSGPFFGGHAQEDQNQITLASHGERWVADCGPVGSSQTPRQSEAHNLVLADGLGQHNSGNSIGTDGSIEASLISTWCDYVRGDATAAYAGPSPFNAPGVPFASSDWSWGYDGGNPLERAGRLCLVFKGAGAPPWVLVGDDVRKDASSHTWDWLLHTAQSHDIDLVSDPARLFTVQASLDVYFAHPRPQNLGLSWAPFTTGGADPGTRRVVARSTSIEPRYCVALVPRAASQPAPVYTSSDDGQATSVSLDWGTVEDVAVFAPYATPVAGAIESQAKMAAVRSDAGAPVAWLVAEGDFLQTGELVLASLDASGSAAWDGATVQLSDAALGFDLWAPAAQAVVAPSGPVPFVQVGDRVLSIDPTDAPFTPGSGFRLGAPQPNPMRSATTLQFHLSRAASARLSVYDARGGRVAVLADGERPAGAYRAQWNGMDGGGRPVAAGIYFAVLEAHGARAIRKIAVLR